MKKPTEEPAQRLRVLMLEDRVSDAELILHELRRAGYAPEWNRVETEAAFVDALGQAPPPDLILADYSLPQFDGLSALACLRKREMDIPFILISGSVGEEVAVGALKQGADDYLLKDSLVRLGSAVRQALDRRLLRAESRRAYEELRASDERFSSAFKFAANGMALVSPDGRWLKVNRSLCSLVGYSEEELLSMTFQEITHPDDLAADLAQMERMLASEIQTYQMEKRYFRKSSELVWVQLNVSLVWDSEGRPLHFISQIQDISARKQAERVLKASLREKEALLKEVHHRVKNNLQVIASLLRLEGRRIEHAVTKSILEQMQDRIHSMALLHETLYRSDNLATVDLSVYLRQVAEQLFRSLAGQAEGVRLSLDVESARVEIDQAIPCGLIVNELATNSLKHGFPGSRTGEVRLRLRSQEPGDTIVLSVSDDGVGLPPEFDLEQARSLGLHLVSDLTRQLQGQLTIGPGPGSMFEVTFGNARRATIEIPPWMKTTQP